MLDLAGGIPPKVRISAFALKVGWPEGREGFLCCFRSECIGNECLALLNSVETDPVME